MKRMTVLLTLSLLLLLTGVALAKRDASAPLASGMLEIGNAGYDLSWHVIGGGGGHSEAASYGLDGTGGQMVVATSADGGYVLCIGFWCGTGARAAQYRTCLPLLMRHAP